MVGRGLAGLVATAELADAGKRVVAARPGARGVARRAGVVVVRRAVPRRHARSSAGCGCTTPSSSPGRTGSAPPASTAPRTTGRGSGPRPTCSSPRGRSAPGSSSRASASSRSSAGPSAAATPPPATATRCRASTSSGAPARACVAPFARRVRAAVEAGLVELRFRHRVDGLVVTGGAVTGVRGAVLEPSAVARGEASSRTEVGAFEITRAGRRRHLRRDRRQPRPGAPELAGPARARRRSGCSPACPRTSTAGCCGPPRPPAPAWSTATGCGTTPRASPTTRRSGHEHGIRILPGPVVAVARRDRHAGCRCRCSPASTPSARSRTSARPATSTPGSSPRRRSWRRSSRSRAPSRTPT